MKINIPEILAANGTGAVLVVFLLLFRIRHRQSGQVHERIFNVMLVSILAALVGETSSFLIDGRVFPGCYFLQYLTNTVCIGQTGVVGFLWCMFVDYRIYVSTKRLKQKAAILGIPLAVITALLLYNLFGNGIVFTVNSENCYSRGKWNLLVYVLLLVFFAESIANVRNARKKGIIPFFFPVYYFAVLWMIGTVIQCLFYGISTGWLSTAVAAVFVCMELQTANFYVDTTAGLFNRQYMNYYLAQVVHSGNKFHGIMLDINDFKSINDIYGHAVGDKAIHAMGEILSQSAFRNAIAMRMGGDEFVVFLSDSNDKECRAQMDAILKHIEEFNKNANEVFRLSVSMGNACFDSPTVETFLAHMDSAMYEAKRKYHDRKLT